MCRPLPRYEAQTIIGHTPTAAIIPHKTGKGDQGHQPQRQDQAR